LLQVVSTSTKENPVSRSTFRLDPFQMARALNRVRTTTPPPRDTDAAAATPSTQAPAVVS
jgi:hypothetical protein